jgi:hypothetical protein
MEPREYPRTRPRIVDRVPSSHRPVLYGDQAAAYAYLTSSRTEKRCSVLRLCHPVSSPEDDDHLNSEKNYDVR